MNITTTNGVTEISIEVKNNKLSAIVEPTFTDGEYSFFFYDDFSNYEGGKTFEKFFNGPDAEQKAIDYAKKFFSKKSK
jgi:hypothetical protein